MAHTGNDNPTGSINLMRGWPNPSLLPVQLIKQAADHALSDPSVAINGLLYGPDPGYEPLRESIADWLSSFYQASSPMTATRICITGGASQNLGCLLSVYTDPSYTRNVWVVAPAYMLAFRVFEDAGFGLRMRAVPEDGEGIDVAFLASVLRKSEQEAQWNGLDRPRYKDGSVNARGKRAKVYKHIIYCVPAFSNPSSRTMTLQRRRELVQLAREYDALLIADDVYDFLQWPADGRNAMRAMQKAHMPRLVDIDRDFDGGTDRSGADGFGNACSNGSFSKIAGPGMRCGWVEGTEKFVYGVSQTGTTASGGAPSQLTSIYIHHMLATGQLQHHIQHILRTAYAARYSILMKAVQMYLLPLGFELPQPTRDIVGGYFVWLSIPSPLTADKLSRRCREHENTIVAPGTIFEVPGDEDAVGFHGHIRLCFAWEEEKNLEEGVRRLAREAKKMLDESDAGDGEYVMVDDASDRKINAFK